MRKPKAFVTLSRSRKSRAASLSVVSNTSLILMKLAAGFLSGSVSILAEALHSGVDLIAAVIALVFVRISDLPPDGNHPYGHGKAEGISGAVEAVLIVFAAVWIVVEAVQKAFAGGAVEHLGLGVLVMGVSVVVNLLVSRRLLRVAREEDSLAILADAHHLTTDVYTSLGVTVGLLLVWATGLVILDSIVAVLVAIFIGRIGLKLTLTAADQLMDNRLPVEDVKRVEEILNQETRIHSWHRLRTRKAGSQRHVDVHVLIPGQISLQEAHEVADELERRIASRLAPAQVIIHLDAYDPKKLQAALVRRQDNADSP